MVLCESRRCHPRHPPPWGHNTDFAASKQILYRAREDGIAHRPGRNAPMRRTPFPLRVANKLTATLARPGSPRLAAPVGPLRTGRIRGLGRLAHVIERVGLRGNGLLLQNGDEHGHVHNSYRGFQENNHLLNRFPKRHWAASAASCPYQQHSTKTAASPSHGRTPITVRFVYAAGFSNR